MLTTPAVVRVQTGSGTCAAARHSVRADSLDTGPGWQCQQSSYEITVNVSQSTSFILLHNSNQ